MTAAELDLAAAPTSPYQAVAESQVAARRKVASQFYRQYGEVPEKGINNEVDAINLTQPVTIGPPPPCPAQQVQWQPPGGRQGQYYADQGTAPTELGIHDEGVTMGPEGWGTGPVEPKITKMYEVPPDAPYMQSTTAPAADTWSIPGETHMAEGGATQRYIPRASSTITEAQ